MHCLPVDHNELLSRMAECDHKINLNVPLNVLQLKQRSEQLDNILRRRPGVKQIL